MPNQLGEEIRRLRLEAGYTLRAFAGKVGISAAHQSDIEHGRRMPGDEVLREMAKALHKVGATLEKLRQLDARLEPDLAKLVQGNPEVGQLLRRVHESGRSPKEILKELREYLDKREKRKD